MLDLSQTQCAPLRKQPQRELNKNKDGKNTYREMSENKLRQSSLREVWRKMAKISACEQPGQMMEGNQERVNE